MELIVVVVISAGMAENSQNGVSRSLRDHTLNSVHVFLFSVVDCPKGDL